MTTEEFVSVAISQYKRLLSGIGKEPNAGRHGYDCECLLCRCDREHSEEFQNWLLEKRDVEILKANIVGLEMMIKEGCSSEEIEAKKKIICRWLDAE